MSGVLMLGLVYVIGFFVTAAVFAFIIQTAEEFGYIIKMLMHNRLIASLESPTVVFCIAVTWPISVSLVVAYLASLIPQAVGGIFAIIIAACIRRVFRISK